MPPGAPERADQILKPLVDGSRQYSEVIVRDLNTPTSATSPAPDLSCNEHRLGNRFAPGQAREVGM